MIREIPAKAIFDTVCDLIRKASFTPSPDISAALSGAYREEKYAPARFALVQILENGRIASGNSIPICQDTGMAVFFIELGQDVHITDGGFEESVREAVARSYRELYLRKSVVADPLFHRVNTRDNTPPVIHTRIVPGSMVRILFIAKGFGSENMSRIAMLPPAAGREGVLQTIVSAALEAGPNACPPMILGVGIGGDFEQAAVMAKRMTARGVGTHHPQAEYAALEKEAMDAINASGIGPSGVGGKCTVLAVNIDTAPTHIASLPVAVNVCCHASRHAYAEL